MKTIEITVDAKGNATVAIRGFAGPECREASRFLERALGPTATERLTAEYYGQPQQAGRRIEQSS
ncbi:hypothetical protein OJF2_05540 [Aquisphaera giovannonii]|uniref:DUF2997 domain-containing protein n=1 Tax=Aquisphaera giovannonii TaxID=406548 RepID=A0A5B9VWD2_9BACT|nr:DUF2997 domain-containing protein [Aquisphaera giovannonii]QEH32085.1 hypothetical protein OJF2_05540 [Aquisphaera giovannonii]